MNNHIRLGAVGVTVFVLLASTGFSAAYQQSNLLNRTSSKHELDTTLDEETLDVKKVLKNIFFSRNDNENPLLEFFTSTITTTSGDVEKDTDIIFGLPNEIDVDNDESTGINGKDIRVQYFILPYFLPGPQFTVGAMFSITVERIGIEISENHFSLSATIGDNLFSVGYESPETESNEVPNHIQVSSTVFFQPFDGATGFSFYMNPSFTSNQHEKQITLFAGVDDQQVKRSFSFGFQPASETKITLRSALDSNEWEYTFTKEASFDTTFTAEMTKTVSGITKETKLTIDSLPEEISFLLSLTPFSSDGGRIKYESESMYDVSVLIETSDIGLCKYALIKNTPRFLSAEWIPSRENGFYDVNLDSDGTSIVLLNALHNPTINLTIRDLSTVDMTAFWNLTNPGDLKVIKDPTLQVDLSLIFEEWVAHLNAKPTAENIYFSWKSNVSGYLTLDTDEQPLSNMDLLVKGPHNGIQIIGETLTADDFHLDWTVWPLSDFYVNKTGSITFLSLSIDVLIGETWYHVWPLFP